MEKIKNLGTNLIIALSLIDNTNASLVKTLSKKFFIKQISKLYKDEYKYFNNWQISAKHFYINKKNNIYYNKEILKKVLSGNTGLNGFLKKFPLLKRKTKTNTIIYIFKSKNVNNKFIYLLFKKGSLRIAAFTSPGKPKYKTPLWAFKTQGKSINKKSKKYNGYPMPFAIHLDGGIFIHWGKIANGKPISHGCFRLKGLASWINYKNIKSFENIPVIFMGYNKSL